MVPSEVATGVSKGFKVSAQLNRAKKEGISSIDKAWGRSGGEEQLTNRMVVSTESRLVSSLLLLLRYVDHVLPNVQSATTRNVREPSSAH